MSYNTHLTANDCFELGRQSYNNGDHFHTVQVHLSYTFYVINNTLTYCFYVSIMVNFDIAISFLVDERGNKEMETRTSRSQNRSKVRYSGISCIFILLPGEERIRNNDNTVEYSLYTMLFFL